MEVDCADYEMLWRLVLSGTLEEGAIELDKEDDVDDSGLARSCAGLRSIIRT